MSDPLPVIVLGAGGHARVVVDVLDCLGLEVLGCVDPVAPAAMPAGLVYLGGDEEVLARDPAAVCLANGVGSIGRPTARVRLFARFKDRGYRFATVVHPAAVLAAGVELGEGVQVMARAVIQPGCRLGDDVIVNTGAVVDHDCRLGPHVHVAPGAVLSGGVTVGPEAHVGTGAAVIQGVMLGARCVVGAGAAVVADVPAEATVVGVPARIRKR